MRIDAMTTTTEWTGGETAHPTSETSVCRVWADAQGERVNDRVIVEAPVTVMVHKVGSFTIMCTPTDLEALAVGFLHAEGMISGADEVIAIHRKEHLPHVVGVEIPHSSQYEIQRNLVVASSCGMCGTRNIEKLLAGVPRCEQTLGVEASLLFEVTDALRRSQEVFAVTGTAHAAAVFDARGGISAMAEDIGRHNALDKTIGKCLLAELPLRGRGVALSSRVSLEMVAKAARAGIELIVAVSGASSLAIEAARQWNITLCGFVRPGRANIYTCSERVRLGNHGRYHHAR
jgi:FdhD protein